AHRARASCPPCWRRFRRAAARRGWPPCASAAARPWPWLWNSPDPATLSAVKLTVETSPLKLPALLAAGVAALSLSACATAQAEGVMPQDNTVAGQAGSADLKAFPAATPGQTRHVIN